MHVRFVMSLIFKFYDGSSQNRSDCHFSYTHSQGRRFLMNAFDMASASRYDWFWVKMSTVKSSTKLNVIQVSIFDDKQKKKRLFCSLRTKWWNNPIHGGGAIITFDTYTFYLFLQPHFTYELNAILSLSSKRWLFKSLSSMFFNVCPLDHVWKLWHTKLNFCFLNFTE